VKCLLIYPNPESALDEEAGKLLLEDYDSYCARAKLITSVHATPKVRPAEFDTPDASSSKTSSSSSSSTSFPSTENIELVIPSREISSTPHSSSTLSPPPHSRKSASPAPQPLQSSGTTSNAAGVAVEKEKDENSGKEGNGVNVKTIMTTNTTSPPLAHTMPLGDADANSPLLGTSMTVKMVQEVIPAKSMKRPATGVVGEKRKKALKRL